MKIFLLGDPVAHSLSPAMHNTAFKELRLDFEYKLWQVSRSGLAGAVDKLRSPEIAGANVTIPYKIEVMQYLDEIDPLAKKIGAVNTIVNKDGKGRLKGYNTDGFGALNAIGEKNLEGKRILMLGAGGAARAISHTIMDECRIEKLVILEIDLKKAEELAKSLSKKASAKKLTPENLEKEIAQADVLINATPVGMERDESPVPKKLLRKNMLVFDVVYGKKQTKLAREASEAGCKIVEGKKMLLLQGVNAFELFTGKKAPVEVMEMALETASKGKCANEEKTGEEVNERENVALVGFMGTGKTVVGKKLAEKLGMKFVDSDDIIEEIAGMKISEIFRTRGEKLFRDIEKQAIEKITSKGSQVISCGGGVVLNEENLKNLKKKGMVVCLNASHEEIYKRVKGEKHRPLLQVEKPLERIRELLEQRAPYYAKADIQIDTNGKTIDEIVKEISGKIKKQ